jgi:hypothetical protein
MNIVERVAARFVAAGGCMVELAEGLRAQEALGTRIAREPWLSGIAVVADEHGSHYLRVNVQSMTNEVRAAVPTEIDGVPVSVEVIGTLRPLP